MKAKFVNRSIIRSALEGLIITYIGLSTLQENLDWIWRKKSINLSFVL